MLRQGANMREIVGGDRTPNLQCIQIAEKYLKYCERERDFVPEIKYFYGPAGAGKTREAYEWLGADVYTANRTTGKFWDGYDAHTSVIIDDFRADWVRPEVFLGMTDRYPYRVETKGGMRQLLARKIAITCPYSPDEVFAASKENLDQFLGRMSEVHHYPDGGQRPMPKFFKRGKLQKPPAYAQAQIKYVHNFKSRRLGQYGVPEKVESLQTPASDVGAQSVQKSVHQYFKDSDSFAITDSDSESSSSF